MSAARCFTFLFLIFFTAGFAQARPLTEHDLLRLRWLADPQISPDGSQVAFVHVGVNEVEDRYDTSLWIVGTDGSTPRALTAGPRDSSPRWSPDGKTIAFARAEEKAEPQLYLLPMSGGEARKLTQLPKKVSSPTWSPDGSTIAFLVSANDEDVEQWRTKLKEPSQKSGQPAPAPAPKKSDVRVITRGEFRNNASGYLDSARPGHIWTVRPGQPSDLLPEPRQITRGKFEESEIFWSPDQKTIYFTSNRIDEPYFLKPDSNLYGVPADGGEIRTIIDIDGPISEASVSRDGARFAFLGFLNPEKVQSDTQTDLFLFEGGKVTNLTAKYDFDVTSGLAGDQRPPRGGGGTPVVWSNDGKSVLVATSHEGRSNFLRIELTTGQTTRLTNGNHDLVAWSATADGSRIAATFSDPTHPGELFLLDAAQGTSKPLTHLNGPLLAEMEMNEPEEIWYPSFDGRKIHGWILKPPGFDPKKKYPMILQIHGGPHTAYGYTFTHEFQWMAAKGYVVLYTNPRGSTTYGQEFANIIQYRYPGDDHKDLMAGVDYLLARGYVDPRKLGITGGSGGGLLTNWAITQTNRFAAAVSQRSIGDWASFWYTADFSQFTPFWFRSTPFKDPSEFAARSPITYVEKINTPLMLIEGEVDYRTPPVSGGEIMFRALKSLRKPVVMVAFPGESHELSRSGKPSHRIERLQHMVRWFDKYLKGEKVDIYDVR